MSSSRDAERAEAVQRPLPPTVREALAPAADVAAAEAWTRKLAHGHYENFSVVSFLLPRRLRQDFCNIYAFCRVADDLGDELGDRQRSLEMLGQFKEATRQCYAGNADSTVLMALAASIRRHDLPLEPFLDLIDAFEQDQRITRYQTFEQVLDYCRRSANPVGRLVLYLCGYRDAERQRLSDQTCSALQLANFWQDVRRDMLERDRIYIPIETMAQFGVTEGQIRDGRCDDGFRQAMRFEVQRTWPMFDEGRKLLPMLRADSRRQISLFGAGGEMILRAIERQNYDTLSRRPALSKWQKGRLMFKALGAAVVGRLGGRP